MIFEQWESAASDGDDDPHDVPGQTTMADIELSVAHDFEDVRESWRQLQRSAVLTPFQSLEWAEAWYETIGRKRGFNLRIVTAEKAGRVVLLLPLVISTNRRLKRLTWIAGQWNDYNVPVIDVSEYARFSHLSAAEFWREVGRLVPEADLFCLPKQPREFGGRRNPFVLPGCLETDSAHAIALDCTWEDFQERCSKSSRRRVRKKQNQLSRKGKVDYRLVEGAAERRQAVGLILKWKSDQLEARGARNPFEDREFSDFLQNLAEHWLNLQVHLLMLDGSPIAGVLALAEERSSIIYQMCFDPAHERQSPGRLLLEEMMHKHIQDGKAVLDFGYGDEPYKVKLTDKRMPLYRGLRGFGLSGRVACFAEKQKLQVERFIKSRRRLLQLYYTMRARPSSIS
ncbi:GNAT family N-acetyltransferase [Chelativorans sp. YIM 93263]|uniref:GNAT family N-acetyltransferase n=1 Tax=Chelativorans sp. YIM 93263 TaxID=2906648 RepID=UPI00237810DF|nr:GNAT family N-acetyltransferase [Chelativorans sp. YIM 93263]